MSSPQDISLVRLGFAFLPALPVIFVLFWWSLRWRQAIYAMSRMLVQLLLIGYVLAFVFEADDWMLVIAILCMMALVASWIASGSIPGLRRELLPSIMAAILICCVSMIAFITQIVIVAEPWYAPRIVLPLAGMIFANSMNSVSLAAERLVSDMAQGIAWMEARGSALQAALIPQVNGLFAVGLVSLPGMMTGQILSGVSPLIAARYQIVVMCMLLGAAGLSSTLFLIFSRRVVDRRDALDVNPGLTGSEDQA